MPAARDLIGETFHELVVKSRAGANRQGSITWLCECSCGKEKVYSSDHLTRKKSPVKSCGCRAIRSGRDHHQWSGCGEISGNWFYGHVLRERKQNSRARIPVTITVEDAWELFLKQDRKCSLSGVELDISPTRKYNTASIDRIDSSKGYEMGNIQWVHKHINFMKRTYSQEYFIEMCSRVAQNNLTVIKN
tara:strand:- start:87 stop:656 length:570 start_codon:yes stop_codon:yes gene_type:complete